MEQYSPSFLFMFCFCLCWFCLCFFVYISFISFIAGKVVVALPTFGRTWKLTTDSGTSGVPPLVADGAGEEGTHSKIKGTLAYYETCTKIVSPTNANAPAHLLRRIPDPNRRLGTYAFRLQRPDHDQEGFWISFEEPETAAQKANYVKTKGLGGIAIVDMSLDDARGVCDGSKSVSYTHLDVYKRQG